MLTQKFTYNKLARDESSGHRLYRLTDGATVPSVTTILDQTKPPEAVAALMEWKKRMGATQAAAITTEASGRGTRMHKYIEDYIKNDVLSPAGTNPYSKQGRDMANIIVENGLKHVDEFWAVEAPLYYPGLYAGTTDCVAVWKGKPAILDMKQTNKPKKVEWIESYFLQLCAYALAHNQLHGTDIETGVILMCSAPNETTPSQYQEFVIEGAEFHQYADKWWDRVDQFYRQRLAIAT
jgi:hypothetical protein